MISVDSIYQSDSHSTNWVVTRCIWFSHIHDIPEDTIIPIFSNFYGRLIAFTSLETKEHKQQELIDYLTKCHDNHTPQFRNADIGTDWKGLVPKHERHILVFAESDTEWFLLQCKYPDIIRVY